jgi:hypothetical protein
MDKSTVLGIRTFSVVDEFRSMTRKVCRSVVLVVVYESYAKEEIVRPLSLSLPVR